MDAQVTSSFDSAETAPAGALLGRGAVIVWNDVAPEGREQFYRWHDKEHIPERLAIPGFRRGRRYIRRGHSPEWLTVYEATDLDVLTSPTYLERLNAPTAQTTSTLRHFRNTSRAVCRVVCSAGESSGGFMLAMRLSAPAGRAGELAQEFARRVLGRSLDINGLVACHLFASDDAASFTRTAESSTRAFDVPSWIVLAEASRPESAEEVPTLVTSALADLGVGVRDAAVYTLEICRLAPAFSSMGALAR